MVEWPSQGRGTYHSLRRPPPRRRVMPPHWRPHIPPSERDTMNSILKKAALAAALATVSLSANAFDADIKVWANVAPTLALLKADGTALDSVVNMVHNPVSGLVPWSQQVRIYSNDESKDIEVRVGSTPQLLNTDGGGTP